MLIVKKVIMVLLGVAFIACLLFMIVWYFIAVAQIGKQNKDKEIDNE